MLIKPGQEFSVATVIEMALRQDIGPDNALGMNVKNVETIQDKKDISKFYNEQYFQRNPLISPEDYFAGL